MISFDLDFIIKKIVLPVARKNSDELVMKVHTTKPNMIKIFILFFVFKIEIKKKKKQVFQLGNG